SLHFIDWDPGINARVAQRAVEPCDVISEPKGLMSEGTRDIVDAVPRVEATIEDRNLRLALRNELAVEIENRFCRFHPSFLTPVSLLSPHHGRPALLQRPIYGFLRSHRRHVPARHRICFRCAGTRRAAATRGRIAGRLRGLLPGSCDDQIPVADRK